MRFGENINYLWKMKKIAFIFLMFCSAFNLKAQNLILNGSFELNNAAFFWNDMDDNIEYANTIFYSKSFGDNFTTSILKVPFLACSPSVLWGGGAKEGDWVLALLGRHETIVVPPPLDTTVHYIKQGKISLSLDAPLLNSKHYKLSFWIKDPPPEPICIQGKNNYINVGISNYEDLLGRHLITTNYGDTIWQEYTYVFETQMAEEYITVTVGVNDTIDYAVFIDHFVLTETEEPLTVSINEISQEKKLLKMVDILGRERKSKKGLLFYIYSDGTVEKKIIVQ
jgi:hypothetical protein